MLQVWDLNNLDAEVQHLNALVVGTISCLEASSKGDNVILCAENSGTARIFNLKTGTTLETQLEHITDLTKVGKFTEFPNTRITCFIIINCMPGLKQLAFPVNWTRCIKGLPSKHIG